jgi:ProP effector
MNMPPLFAAEAPVAPPAEAAAAAPPPVPEASPRDILKTLYARFPVFRTNEPLAIGIDKAVRAELPDLPRKSLRIALSIHTHSNRYLRNMAKAGQRLDLQGAPAGEITDSQRQYAAECLRERLKKQAEAAATAAPPAPEATPAPSSRKRPSKPPAHAPRRAETAAPPQPRPPAPQQEPETATVLSLTEKLALLSEKYSRK